MKAIGGTRLGAKKNARSTTFSGRYTPSAATTEWSRFDTGLRHALRRRYHWHPDICARCSVAPFNTTCPFRRTRSQRDVYSPPGSIEAFLGCCAAVRNLVSSLLVHHIMITAFIRSSAKKGRCLLRSHCNSERVPGEDTAREAFLSRLPTPPDLNMMSSRQGQLQAILDEAAHSKSRSTACLQDHDLARLTALSAPHTVGGGGGGGRGA